MKKEIPILFSTPMVQAILEGRKTMTRRIIPESYNGCLTNGGPHPCPNEPVVMYPGEVVESPIEGQPDIKVDWTHKVEAHFHCSTLDSVAKCRFGKPGDILWVRETFYEFGSWMIPHTGPDTTAEDAYWDRLGSQERKYAANTPKGQLSEPYGKWFWRKIPSIHMPKEAARIWLEVTEIRVEALHDISEDDARAEGVLLHERGKHYLNYMDEKAKVTQFIYNCYTAKESFKTLWMLLNGVRDEQHAWFKNPWVWVVSFKVLSTTGRPSI